MNIKKLFPIILLAALFSCSSTTEDRPLIVTKSYFKQKQSGINIQNGQRQGFQYIDSNGTEFSYRYYTISITNDSIIPIHLDISFSRQNAGCLDTLGSRFFLLPRHLTPRVQQFDHSVSQQLKSFLDHDLYKPERFVSKINQGEFCTVTIGVLTNIKDREITTPYGTGLTTSDQGRPRLDLIFEVDKGLIIPCGQLSFSEH